MCRDEDGVEDGRFYMKETKETTILIADDNTRTLDAYRSFLENYGHRIITEEDGLKAVGRAIHEKPDVIILDLVLPEMDGWQVCNRIREFSDVPILTLSSLGMPRSVARALDAGADDCMVKPVHATLLASRLRTLVQQHALGARRQVA